MSDFIFVTLPKSAYDSLQDSDLPGHGWRILKWLVSTFGSAAVADKHERAARVVEEAIELAQAEGVSHKTIDRIMSRAFSRPAGERTQEAGGLMVTLLAWATSQDIDLLGALKAEIERIEQPDVIARIRAKQAEKAMAGTGADYPMTDPKHLSGLGMDELGAFIDTAKEKIGQGCAGVAEAARSAGLLGICATRRTPHFEEVGVCYLWRPLPPAERVADAAADAMDAVVAHVAALRECDFFECTHQRMPGSTRCVDHEQRKAGR